jgi:hypothetical protein
MVNPMKYPSPFLLIFTLAALTPVAGNAQPLDIPPLLFEQVRYVTITDSRIGGNSGFVQFRIGLSGENRTKAERFKQQMVAEGYDIILDNPKALDISASRGWKVDYVLPIRIPKEESFKISLLKFATGKAFPALLDAAGGAVVSNALELAGSLDELIQLYRKSRKPSYKGFRIGGQVEGKSLSDIEGDYLLRIVRSGGLDQPAGLYLTQHLHYTRLKEGMSATVSKVEYDIPPPDDAPPQTGGTKADLIPFDMPLDGAAVDGRLKHSYGIPLEQERIFPLPTPQQPSQTTRVITPPPWAIEPSTDTREQAATEPEPPAPPTVSSRERFEEYFKETIWRDAGGEKGHILHLHAGGKHSVHHELDGPTIKSCDGRRRWSVVQKAHSGRLALETHYYIQDRKCYGGTYSCTYYLDPAVSQPKRLEGKCEGDPKAYELVIKKPAE